MRTVHFDIHLADRQIAGLTMLAIGLHMLEASFPSPLPGVKPGMANIVVIYVWYRFGFRTAASVSLLRVLASSLLFGQLFTPSFFLSLAGAIASLISLWLAQCLSRHYFTAVSVSVLAALAHVFGQLCLVRLWLIPLPQAWLLLAPLWVTALIFGVSNGLVIEALRKRADSGAATIVTPSQALDENH